MNRKEIINKIREIFGMAQESFGVYKNEEGVEFRIEELELEKEVYIITPEGELPAPDGLITLDDGTKVKVMEGKITDLNILEVEEEMDEAELADGTKVLTKEDGEFKEGQTLYVVDAEGNEVIAPEGEHTTKSGITLVVDAEGSITGVKYPDEDGEGSLEAAEHGDKDKEEKMAEATLVDGTIVEVDGELEVGAEIYVKTEEGRQLAPDADHETIDGIIVSTKDGVITEIKEKEEAGDEVKEEELSEILETFANALETLNNELVELKKNNEELNNKFSKFASEPAADKIYDRKGAYVKEIMAAKVGKLEQLAALRRGIK